MTYNNQISPVLAQTLNIKQAQVKKAQPEQKNIQQQTQNYKYSPNRVF